MHAPASLTGATNRVKLTDEESGEPEKGGDTIAHFGEKRARNSPRLLRCPLAPIEVLQMVGKNNSPDGLAGRNGHLKRIPLGAGRHRTDNCQASFLVLASRRKDDRGPASSLLSSHLRCKVEPDQTSGIWYVFAGYHSSFPADLPQSVSPCRFAGVIRRTSWLSFCLPFFLKILRMPGSPTDTSNWSPGGAWPLRPRP